LSTSEIFTKNIIRSQLVLDKTDQCGSITSDHDHFFFCGAAAFIALLTTPPNLLPFLPGVAFFCPLATNVLFLVFVAWVGAEEQKKRRRGEVMR
jgi:hypothetical protein